ncbi:hypothetical protein COPCOM_01902 [Coprococcus comes ATCC 27758]|uniref:Uncharacterized protein n=1 Tax=Coprococcus comes ATCC 27758 TaxID=470146 RepID=C0B9S5_9FIRM|nr:hypothetical protein COPCOM_01902 [Coprococcus comes ATCC 27758]
MIPVHPDQQKDRQMQSGEPGWTYQYLLQISALLTAFLISLPLPQEQSILHFHPETDDFFNLKAIKKASSS